MKKDIIERLDDLRTKKNTCKARLEALGNAEPKLNEAHDSWMEIYDENRCIVYRKATTFELVQKRIRNEMEVLHQLIDQIDEEIEKL